jgi:hypothetical protein
MAPPAGEPEAFTLALMHKASTEYLRDSARQLEALIREMRESQLVGPRRGREAGRLLRLVVGHDPRRLADVVLLMGDSLGSRTSRRSYCVDPQPPRILRCTPKG